LTNQNSLDKIDQLFELLKLNWISFNLKRSPDTVRWWSWDREEEKFSWSFRALWGQTSSNRQPSRE